MANASENSGPTHEFSDAFFAEIKERVEGALKTGQAPRVAAFDADGTLWDRDAGETFFDWQIKNCRLALPADPWSHYHRLKVPDPRVAYTWLAEISAGHELAQVRRWAAECFRGAGPWPTFASQLRLVEWLRSKDFDIYIVTASVKWAVEPLAHLYGVDFEHVLGITTQVVDGRVSKTATHPITWRQGKAEALLKVLGGARPILACGNTYGDSALIETATHVSLTVSTQVKAEGPLGGLFEEERKLREEARARGWLMHAFRPLESPR